MTWRRTCPNCQAHYGGLVHDSCPLCHGDGFVRLDDERCEEDEPHTVGRGVSMFLGWIIQEPEGEGRTRNLVEAEKVLRRAHIIAEHGRTAVHALTSVNDEPGGLTRRRMARDAARLVQDLTPVETDRDATITDLSEYAKKRSPQ